MKIDTILERGKFIRDLGDPSKLVFFPENRQKIINLYSRIRFEWVLARDGGVLSIELKEWIIRGKRGSCFESGINKLGFSIEGTPTINKIKSMRFAECCQDGDGEANFVAEWTKENESRILDLIKPTRRREGWTIRGQKQS